MVTRHLGPVFALSAPLVVIALIYAYEHLPQAWYLPEPPKDRLTGIGTLIGELARKPDPFPVTTIAPNATTISVGYSSRYVTSDNTQPTIIKDLKGADEGQVIRIIAGGTAYPSRLISDKKWRLAADWTPGAPGDSIMLVVSNGKYHELSRYPLETGNDDP
jgi:hypothetical protein